MNRSDMISFIHGINEHQASQVIKALLDNNPDFLKKVYDIAVQVVGNVDTEEIADNVYYALDVLDIEMLSGRAGRTRYGYVEPTEAAWEIFEEAITPFIDEMKKSQQRALPAVAKSHCVGIVKGLIRYGEDSSSDLKEWVSDAPNEYVYTVIQEWERGNPPGIDIAEVMEIVKEEKA